MIDWTPMETAVKIAESTIFEDQRPHPKVGAVLANKQGVIVATAFRGQFGKGDHAEYILLEKAKEAGIDLTHLTLYTTLEPCIARGHRKTACAVRVCSSGIRTVVIGMVDPNPQMRGLGISELQANGIDVHLAPSSYYQQIVRNNERFVHQFSAAA